MVLLLPFAFVLIYFGLGILPGPGKQRDRVIQAVLFFSLLIVFSTEVLSILNLYSLQGLAVFWTLFNIILLIITFTAHKRQKDKISIVILFQKLRRVPREDRFYWLVIVLLLSGIFFQGLIYPPNNWDSMTYHMARIVHWVQNSNVNYYPTNIIRQLYQPPFAEFFISQICILSKNDIWANFIQLFFLISTLFAMAGIARELGLSVHQQMVTLFLVVTIPEVILQSSNTQNDVVVSFFIAAAVYYCLICYKQGFTLQYFLLALSIGLAFLTKATAYIYLAPVLFVFGFAVIFKAFKKQQWDFIYKYIFLLVVVLMINGGFYYRNYILAGNLFGTQQDESRYYSNEDHKPSALVSNITRNVAVHYGVPGFSTIAENIVKRIHGWVGQKTNDPETTWEYAREFKINPYGTHEDWGANIIQVSLALVIFIAFLLFPHKARKEILFYFLVIISMFLLFCFYLKWQPWHSRLHTPLFILVTPVMACFLSSFNLKKISVIISFMITVYAFLVLSFNFSRPLCPKPPFTADIKLTDDRFKKYFVNRQAAYGEYQAISEYLKLGGFTNIGLKMSKDDWEYPLFCDVFKRPVMATHIDVKNISRNIHQSRAVVDCIVSSEKRNELFYYGIIYYNFTPLNSVLYLYTR